MSNLEKAKQIVQENIEYGGGGLFCTRNFIGDRMATIYHENGLRVDICYYAGYFEVFGLTGEEFAELEKFYGELRGRPVRRLAGEKKALKNEKKDTKQEQKRNYVELSCPHCHSRFMVEDKTVPPNPVPKVILNGWRGMMVWDGKEYEVMITAQSGSGWGNPVIELEIL